MVCTECGNTGGIEEVRGSVCCSLCGKELQDFELEEGDDNDEEAA